MNEHSKQYNDLKEIQKATKAMRDFQFTHNIIRQDYIELLRITEINNCSDKTFNALYRASLRSLFSLIEADLHGFNQLDEYNNYLDKETFIKKFKKTFKQIAKTWNKTPIQKEYFDSKLNDLKILKKMRDELIHPKEPKHIHKATEEDFEKLKTVFRDYDELMNCLMKNFFLSISIPQ